MTAGDAAPNERSRLAALRAGDEEVFRSLVTEYGPPMLRIAVAFTADRQVAEEVVQETWIAVLKNLDAFQGRSSLRTWIFTILANCARGRVKREQRSAPFSAIGESENEPNAFFDANHPRWAHAWTSAVPRWDALPERALQSALARQEMLEALRELPSSQCVVLTLRDIEGWSSEEVCALLELSPANQRVLLHRGRLALRRALERAFEAEGVVDAEL